MRKIFLILISLLLCLPSFAEGDRYDVSLLGMYGWNETWKSHGGVDLLGFMPVSPHFEATAALEVHSPKAFAAAVTARPKLPLPFGELFLDGSVHYRQLSSYAISDFNLAASLGYRFEYLSVQCGLISHWTFDLEHSGANVSEPVYLLYRLSFNVRPASSRWNLGGGIANYTDFEYERTWAPIPFIHARFNVDDNFTLLLRSECKPAGIFHQAAQFWGVTVRAGVRYTFGR